MIYFDANYLVRLYFKEPGYEAVRHLAAQHPITCSLYGRAEVTAAFHRKLREGVIPPRFYSSSLKQFTDECSRGAFSWIPLSSAILERLDKTYATLPATLFLRAGDAIHLASAAENGLTEIYSNDQRLLAAAPPFGIKGINVI